MPRDYVSNTTRSKKKQPPKQPREPSVVTQEAVDARRKIFADAILEGESETNAARIAGYHPSNAKNVMREEDVQLMIAEGRKEIQDVSTIKRLDVLNWFIEAIDMARTMADPGQMINGAKEVGKMMGFYEPETIKLAMDGSDGGNLAAKFKAMTDEELYHIASQRAKVIDGESEVVE